MSLPNDCLFLNTTYKDFKPSKKHIEIDENLNQMIKIYDEVDSRENPQDDFLGEFFSLDFFSGDKNIDLNSKVFDYGQFFKPNNVLSDLTFNFTSVRTADFERENHVFSFMVEKIFPNCICYGGEYISNRNPYLNYLVPLSFNSEILLKALISYSAKVYSLMHDREFENLSLKYKDEVLKDLPALIRSKHSSKSSNWEEVFGTILILCSSNISSDCDMQWIIHSQGGKKLLNMINVNDLDPFKKFFIRYLTSHEIMRETIAPVEEDSFCLAYENFKNDHDDEIDLMLGCSPNLLRIISEITNLGECYESLEQESRVNKFVLEELIFSKKKELLKQLDSLIQTTEDGDPNIQTIADVKRLSAKVYLFSRIDLLELKYKSKGATSGKFLKLNQLINDIIAKIESINYCSMSLLWPLFMVGLTGVNLDDQLRLFILKKFNEMENRRHLASVRMARYSVETVWKHRDLRDSEILTWKELVLLNNETISLA